MSDWPYDRHGRRKRRGSRIRWSHVWDNWGFFFLGGCLTVLVVHWLIELFERTW